MQQCVSATFSKFKKISAKSIRQESIQYDTSSAKHIVEHSFLTTEMQGNLNLYVIQLQCTKILHKKSLTSDDIMLILVTATSLKVNRVEVEPRLWLATTEVVISQRRSQIANWHEWSFGEWTGMHGGSNELVLKDNS
jgi:hypothetical protein